MVDFPLTFSEVRNVYQPGAGNIVADALSRCPIHKGATGKITTKGQASELGSQQMEFDVAKVLVFALREIGLEAGAL